MLVRQKCPFQKRVQKRAQKRYRPTINLRTCSACRTTRPKTELLRFVRRRDGVHIDVATVGQGRGAYVCRDTKCAESAFDSGAVARTLKVRIEVERSAMLRRQALEYLLGGK
ncbi:MAG: YlxR family protein [Actinomycetota bacterium]